MKRHHMQIARHANLVRIQDWIKESGGVAAIDREALIRKCLLVIGCSRKTALDYLDVILGGEPDVT